MYKTFIYIILLIGFLLPFGEAGRGFAQNLIPNPSFEIYDTCPARASDLGDPQIEHCLGWYAPAWGTSDYFNSCNTFVVNVPNAAFGYQHAYDGVGMLGMGLLIDVGAPAYFEYVQAKLLAPLSRGYTYQFSFKVNLANGSSYGVKKMGAWFTPNAVSSNNGLPLFSVTPQIENNTGFITDTVGWSTIEGEFVAEGGEEYITIGYYTDTLNPDTVRVNPIAASDNITLYCYIDGLVMEEVTPTVEIPNIITPNGDGMNDVFQLNFPYSHAKVYNRWGQLIFNTVDNTLFWDGKSKGKDVPDGTYYYLIKVREKKYKGFVQVIR